MKPLYIMIGCDCDHDRSGFHNNIRSGGLSWDGFLNVMTGFNRIRDSVEKLRGLKPCLVLNIRADEHVRAHHGRYDYCFALYSKHVAKLCSPKDETAWHHHQFRLKDGRWTQEYADDTWIRDHILQSYEGIKGYPTRYLHTGWCFQNTASMNAYNDAGITVDYSALPGMKNQTGPVDLYDYTAVAGRMPYIPARNDYQRPGEGNALLEIPATTLVSPGIQFMQSVNQLIKYKRVPQDWSSRAFAPVNIHPVLFRAFFADFFEDDDPSHYVTYFHADELLPDAHKNWSMRMLYSNRHWITNLLYVIDTCRENGREPVFVNLSQLVSVLREMT